VGNLHVCDSSDKYRQVNIIEFNNDQIYYLTINYPSAHARVPPPCWRTRVACVLPSITLSASVRTGSGRTVANSPPCHCEECNDVATSSRSICRRRGCRAIARTDILVSLSEPGADGQPPTHHPVIPNLFRELIITVTRHNGYLACGVLKQVQHDGLAVWGYLACAVCFNNLSHSQVSALGADKWNSHSMTLAVANLYFIKHFTFCSF
jgi:hypothetical protein